MKPLLSWTTSCVWAQAVNKDLQLGNKIFCLQWPEEEQKGDVTWKDPGILQLVSSGNYFEKEKQLVTVGGGVPVLGLTPFWLVGVVKMNQGGHQLIASKDGSNFVRSTFTDRNGGTNEHRQSIAFSILESSNTTLFVDVVSTLPGGQLPAPFGTLYVSSSDGNYFRQSLEHTNRDLSTGMADFEHIQSTIYEGVVLASTVKNWRDLLDRKTIQKELSSSMSFDNGRRWSLIRPPEKDLEGKPFGCTAKEPTSDCSLHLHSVTTSRNVGRVFSVSSAPGIIIGVGSVGAKLNPYDQSDTFISEDSGRTWRQVARGPHKFEILNFGSVIVLIPDAISNYVHFSKNRGKTWEKLEFLVDEAFWIPMFTMLDPDSTTSSMIAAVSRHNAIGQKYLLHLDFSSLYTRICSTELNSSNSDLELWKLETPGGRCLLGTSVSHYRRKADADCSMSPNFGTGLVANEPCPCADYDYECDSGFASDESSSVLKCIAAGPVNDQPLDCKVGTKYQGLSGYRKIPGNQCKGGDDKKADPVPKDCKEGPAKPPNQPLSKINSFNDHIIEILQVPKSPVSIMLNREGFVWRSPDQGSSWTRMALQQPIVRIIPHETKKDRLFLFSADKIYISDDALAEPNKIIAMNTPEPYNAFGIPAIDFHPTKLDWYTFVSGGRDCGSTNACHSKAYLTKDNGKTFTLIETWATKCVWALDVHFKVKEYPEDAVFCTSFKIKDGKVGQDKAVPSKENPTRLVLITQEGKSLVPLLDTNVLDFFVVKNVLLVATGDTADPILYSSIDAQQFKKVSFPPSIKLNKNAFTLLPSTTEGIFLDIAQSVAPGSEFGILFKSNENGLFFSRSLGNTNRGPHNQVDFIKFPGLEGVALGNVVTNAPLDSKEVKTMISFDDGSTWNTLQAPKTDVFNNPIDCTGKCSLNLHITVDAGVKGMLSPFGTPGSAGLLMAVGNVGESLGPYEKGNVYMTRNGGKDWIEIQKGPHIWAIADYGGLLVLANNANPVDSIVFSWDFGKSWATHKISDRLLRIESIVAHEGSNRVSLTGHYGLDSKVETIAVYIDFSTLFTRKCDRNGIDFEEWTPDHGNGCFFGQKTTYLRRVASSICYIGENFTSLKPSSQTCECTSLDYECDYNFYRDGSGACVLYGIDPEQPTNCIDGTKYKGSSGYRKISLSKCVGGKDLALPVERTCGDQAGPENVKMSTFYFDAPVDDFFYFKATGTIMVKDTSHNAYISDDEGIHWRKVTIGEKETINAVVQDPFHTTRAFIVTSSSSLWVTPDVGKSFRKIEINGPPDVTMTPNFIVTHPTNADWIIWIGTSDCAGLTSTCHTVAQVSWDAGSRWSPLTTYAQSCVWGTTPTFQSVSDKTIFCSVYAPQAGNQRSLIRMNLMRSDYGDSNFVSLFEINGFTIESEYLIAAVVFFS